MDDHTFVAASIWKFTNPQPFIDDFMAKAGHMVSACQYDDGADVFEMTCSSFHQEQVRALFIANFRKYVNSECERTGASAGDPFEQQTTIERLVESNEIPQDIFAKAKSMYEEEQRCQPIEGGEKLVSMESPKHLWVTELATDVAFKVFSTHTFREIASHSGCEVNWHSQVPGGIEIAHEDEGTLVSAVQALESVQVLYAGHASDRVNFDLCYDDTPGTHQFRFVVPSVTLDSALCSLPNFFREYHETVVASWDSVSLQYRMKPRATNIVTYPKGFFCPWIGAGGFGYGSLPSIEDDWLPPEVENAGSLELMLARSRLSDQNRKIMEWREKVADPLDGDGRPTLAADTTVGDSGNLITLGDAKAKRLPTRVGTDVGAANQQPSDHRQDRSALQQRTANVQTDGSACEHPKPCRPENAEFHTASWKEMFANRGRRPEAIEAERLEALAKEHGVEEWQLPKALRAPPKPSTSTSAPLVDILEDDSRADSQSKYHYERKLRGPKRPPKQTNSSTSPAPEAVAPICEDRLALEQARDRLHKEARISIMRILKLSLASHRCAQIHVDLFLGKLFVDSKTLSKNLRCRKNQSTGYFTPANWGAVFAIPAGGPRGSPSGTAASVLSKRLCTTWDEVRALLDIWDEQVDRPSIQLFDPHPIKQKDLYVLHCRNEQDQSEAIIQIEVGEESPADSSSANARHQHGGQATQTRPTKEIFRPRASLGNVNIHCPGQTWDMALQVSGSSKVDHDALPAFWPIHESVCVTSPNGDGKPGKVYAKSAFPSVKVVSVELRREKVHGCRVNPDLSIVLTQVRGHRIAAHTSGDGRVCAWQPSDEQMLAEGRLWWEARLRSRGLSDCLHIRDGLHTEYARLQQARDGVIKPSLKNLLEAGMWVVPRIDAIGNASYLFEKPSHEPTLAMSGTQAVPSMYLGQQTQSLI